MTYIVNPIGVVDPNNTTSTPLSSQSVFIGTPTSCQGYNSVYLYSFASNSTTANSISNGIQVQFSDSNIVSSYTTGSTITGSPANNIMTLNASDSTTLASYYIIITDGPFKSQNNVVSSLSGQKATLVSQWYNVSLTGTITSVVASSSGTVITIDGTSLPTTYITAGTSILLTINSVPQNYLVTSVTTNTSTQIVLSTTGNATTGTATNAVLLTSPGSGFNYNTSSFVSEYQDTYYSPVKYVRSFQVIKKYYRIIYINDGIVQSIFNLSSYLTPVSTSEGIVVNFEPTRMDLYGKLQVVEPFTLFELKFQAYKTNIDIFSTVLYTSNATNLPLPTPSNSTLNLVASTGGAGTLVCQSKRYAIYQPGKTMLMYFTGILNNGSNTNGTTTYIGYFDNILASTPTFGGNGLYFSYNPLLGISVNLLNSNGATLTTVPQYLWNGDRMDGSGPSGIKLSFNKMQFFMIQFAWLGAGLIQFGFNCFGQIHICHTFTNYNTLSFPWATSPNLPVRYQITTASSTDSGSLLVGCASVISEGGYNIEGRIFSCSNLQNIVNLNTTETPVLAITGTTTTTIGSPGIGSSTTNTYYHQLINVLSLSAISTATNVTILISLRLYPSGTSFGKTGTVWTDVDTSDSVVKYAQGGTGVGQLSDGTSGTGTFTTTGSKLIYQDYIFGKSQPISANELTNLFSTIGSNYLNVSDIIIVTGMYINANGTTPAQVSLTWQEAY
jgi:hypothetical protein